MLTPIIIRAALFLRDDENITRHEVGVNGCAEIKKTELGVEVHFTERIVITGLHRGEQHDVAIYPWHNITDARLTTSFVEIPLADTGPK